MKLSRALAIACLLAVPLTTCKKGGAPASSAPVTDGSVINIPLVAIAADAGASDNVRAECQLDSKIPQFVEAYSGGGVQLVAQADPSQGRVLTMQIVHMLGTGGGMYSGPKQITLEGTLTENGTVVGSFKGRRTTTGGGFGGFKGTCSLLGRCAKALGKDVAGWLKAPTMNAGIGEM